MTRRRVSARVDIDLFVEAVANLPDNALKFVPAGGVVGLGLHREVEGSALALSFADNAPKETRVRIMTG